MNNMNIKWISKNNNGDFYVGYTVKVSRGIRGKTKSKVDEVLIIGIPKSEMESFCNKHNINYKIVMEELKNG